MTEARPFHPVKLICGIIASKESVFEIAGRRLQVLYGSIDLKSPLIDFTFTNYYEKEMGKNLKRQFLSFEQLISPERLSDIKLCSNRLEREMREENGVGHRIVNLDPGYLTASALFMATAKDFAHRVPMKNGIYAHLELMFGKADVRTLSWTYPDFKTAQYQEFFLTVRKQYLKQLKT